MNDLGFIFSLQTQETWNDMFQAFNVTINQDVYTQQCIKSSIS